MPAYNPNDEQQLKRLRDAMRWSVDRLKPFRDTYLKMLRQYVGNNYGDDPSTEVVPLNMLRITVDTYHRQLVARTPQVLVRTADHSLKAEAEELRLATNHMLREMDFHKTMREVTKAALFCFGAVKVGITSAGLGDAAGVLHDAGIPYCDAIAIDDWLHDANATRWEAIDWCGNYYRLPYDAVMEAKEFSAKAKAGLQPSSKAQDGMLDSNERANALSTGGQIIADEYRDYVDLFDVWLPADGLLVTITREDGRKPLRIIEWEGPERGPYHVLSFAAVPGNLMPASPLANVLDMHLMLNRLFVKLGRQAERQKDITVADGKATADGSANTIIEAEDGQAVRVESPDRVRQISMGGINQLTMAFFSQLRPLISYAGGNIDAIAGLSQQASTLGQERILKTSSSELVSDFQDTTVEFIDNVVTDIAYYVYTDPNLQLNLKKKVPGTSIEIPFVWDASRRENDYFSFKMNVEPYSIQARSPGERLQTLLTIFQQVLVPNIPGMQQQGITIKMDEVMRIIAQLADLEELAEILDIGGVPMGLEQSSGDRPLQAPVTERHNVRHNVSTGGTQANREATLIQSLLGNAQQPDQATATQRI